MSDCGDAFPIDLTGGELVFVDPYDDKEEVSIPNPAMRFVDEGTFRFMLRQFVGDDVETVGTVHPYPQVEKQRVVPVAVDDLNLDCWIYVPTYSTTVETANAYWQRCFHPTI